MAATTPPPKPKKPESPRPFTVRHHAGGLLAEKGTQFGVFGESF